jgi:hypothetical protein
MQLLGEAFYGEQLKLTFELIRRGHFWSHAEKSALSQNWLSCSQLLNLCHLLTLSDFQYLMMKTSMIIMMMMTFEEERDSANFKVLYVNSVVCTAESHKGVEPLSIELIY